MNTYLARITECLHGYVSCTFGDCPGGTTTRIEPRKAHYCKTHHEPYSRSWQESDIAGTPICPYGPPDCRIIDVLVVDAALGGSEDA